MSTIIIDSKKRNSGNSLTHFTLQLSPSIENVSKCRLVWADIPIPTGASESYYVITIPQRERKGTRHFGSAVCAPSCEQDQSCRTQAQTSIYWRMRDYVFCLHIDSAPNCVSYHVLGLLGCTWALVGS